MKKLQILTRVCLKLFFLLPIIPPPNKISVWDIRSSINNCAILRARTNKSCVVSLVHENKYPAAKKNIICNKMKDISVMCCFLPFFVQPSVSSVFLVSLRFTYSGSLLIPYCQFPYKNCEPIYFHTVESSISIMFWSQPFYFYTKRKVTTLATST